MSERPLPIVLPEQTILAALSVIDKAALEIALVVTASRELIGTVTDGDIRRGLLRGQSLEDPVLAVTRRGPYCVSEGTSRADVLDLLRVRRIAHAPVLDSAGRVVGLHTLSDFLNPKPLATRALIMAGGRGSRLGKLTATTPKPMMRVAGRPILEWIILNLVGGGVSDISISVNYLARKIVDYFGDGSAFGAKITYLHEDGDQPLGTAGALAYLDAGNRPVLMMNGDLMTRFAPADLIGHHMASGCSVTVALHAHTYEVPYGVVRTDQEGTLIEILEKPLASWDVAAGVYVISPELLELLIAGQRIDAPEVVDLAIKSGARVGTWRLPGDWADIGRPMDLSTARGEF